MEVRFDSGLGADVHLDGDRLEIREQSGTVSRRIAELAGVAISGGRLSRQGTLEFRFGGGESVRVPFARNQRAQAAQLRGRIRQMLRPAPSSSDLAAYGAELQQRVDEMRRRNAESIELRRRTLTEQLARGDIGSEAQDEFERLAARSNEDVERECERLMQEFEELVRRAEKRGADGA
ncbi:MULTISPECIES: hypothetical protein [Streptomonospora]|uniref:Uncharacterized protein n=2 Tax=Streptomonospora TaxID=104204 RepID=A0ABV9SLE8_9ACTN